MDNPANTGNPLFWRPVKLGRDQAMSIIALRRCHIKRAERAHINAFMAAGREELRQLVDCGAISQGEQDFYEREYTALCSERLVQLLPARVQARMKWSGK